MILESVAYDKDGKRIRRFGEGGGDLDHGFSPLKQSRGYRMRTAATLACTIVHCVHGEAG